MPQLAREDQTHDLSLQKIGGTEYGFILVRDRGRPQMRIGSAPTPQSQGASDTEASYASISPDIDKVVAQEDWRKGMGQDKYSDARRYAESIGCDARSKGGVLLGPVKNDASTINSVAYGAGDIPVLVNGGFETWSGAVPDGWQALASATFTKDTTSYQGGAASLKVNSPAVNKGVSQYLGHNGCFSTLPQITFSAYGMIESTYTWKVRIMLNGSEVATSTHTQTSTTTFEQQSVNYTPTNWNDSNEIEVRVEIVTIAAGTFHIDTAAISFSGQAYTGTAALIGTLKVLIEYSSGLYLVTSTAVWKWNTSTSKWDRLQASPDSGVQAGTWSDGTTDFLFVCRGTTKRWWRYDGTNWAVNSLSGDARYCDFFINIGANAWKALKPNKLASASDAFNGIWTQITVDKVADDFTGLIDVAGVPYMGKENGLYKYVSPTVTEIATEIRTQTATTTGKNLLFWKSSVLFPAGTQALWEYQPADNALGSLSPGESSPGMVAYSGRTYALAGDDQFAYAFLGGASGKIELLAGRYESIEGTTYWVWHPILQLTASDVAHAVISAITSPSRLWFISTESSVAYIRYIILPDKYSDVTQATSYTFATGGEFITGTMDMGFVDQDKPFASVVVLSENLTANITIAVSYKIDADASWTALGTVTTSPLATLYFPTTSVKYGKKIRLRFVLATNSTATSPRLKAYALHGLVAFTRRELFNFTVKVADNLRMLNGREENQQEWVLAGALRDLANQPWVILKLPRETTAGVQEVSTYYVRMSIEDTPLWKEPEERSIRVFNVQAVEVKLSA